MYVGLMAKDWKQAESLISGSSSLEAEVVIEGVSASVYAYG
jgi:hypothetical protein